MSMVVDLSEALEPEEMSVCPLCDNSMFDWDECAIFLAHGDVALAHVSCIAEKRTELGV